jgi:hypothetical protein
MSRHGMLVPRSAGQPDAEGDWTAPSLGSRMDVMLAIATCMPGDEDQVARLSLTLEVESADESEEPRCIVARGDWGEPELEVLRALCELLDARFFDAAALDFVRL